jgi:hypothetical protein
MRTASTFLKWKLRKQKGDLINFSIMIMILLFLSLLA